MKKIILASNNKGKIAEFNTMLNGIYQVVSMSDMQVEEVPETGLTFVENALIKARNASEQSGLPALSDDSGIVVDALNGEPGIYSARYAGNHGDDEANTQKLLDQMRDVADGKRTARFWCAIVFVEHANDPTPIIISTRLGRGNIAQKSPVIMVLATIRFFYVPTHECASAELSPEIKNSISHRGKALVALLEELKA